MRRTLRELPESLDETYERILKEIKKPNRGHARRVLQCLVVAIRPLRVGELAEVLAVDFDDAEGIPTSKRDWRWEDEEVALQSACSSLIAIVETGDSRVVQFSHFSVKEFLTSSRPSTSSGEVSSYHIDLEPAHTILAQTCLGVLLQIQHDIDEHTPEDHPLAGYAAEHWTTHAQFGGVSSHLQKGMEHLFNADKPHFEVWLTLYDIDPKPDNRSAFYFFTSFEKSPATPLYYAVLCGFHDLAGHLITKYRPDVNADGGYYMRPLVAALAGEHFQTADLLREHGADPYVRGHIGSTPLHSAALHGNLTVVEKLIEYNADINAENWAGCTPLYWASGGHYFKDGSVLRLLLKHGAKVNSRTKYGATPLHQASYDGALEVVRLLLEHGADVDARDGNGLTALDQALNGGSMEVARLLREHGGNSNNQELFKSTSPHLASGHGFIPTALPKYDMDVDASSWTQLHFASHEGYLEDVRLLIGGGENPDVKNEDQHTPLFLASANGRLEVVRFLLQNGADLNMHDWLGKTPLHGASENGHFQVMCLLLERGADVDAKDSHFWTPLHMASKTGNLEAARELLDRGAEVGAQDDLLWTSLHLASQEGHREIVELLLNRHATRS